MNLKPGEIICDKCNGTGKFIDDLTVEGAWKHPWCPKCHGSKKVDWASNAIWKKKKSILNQEFTPKWLIFQQKSHPLTK